MASRRLGKQCCKLRTPVWESVSARKHVKNSDEPQALWCTLCPAALVTHKHLTFNSEAAIMSLLGSGSSNMAGRFGQYGVKVWSCHV